MGILYRYPYLYIFYANIKTDTERLQHHLSG